MNFLISKFYTAFFWICHTGLIVLFYLYKVLYFDLRLRLPATTNILKQWRRSEEPKLSRARVVIIGGGFSGSYAAHLLARECHVTLIDDKAHFEFTPSVLRVLVQPHKMQEINRLHKGYLPHVNVVVGRVDQVTPYHVSLTTTQQIPFDYLIVASGASYRIPPELELDGTTPLICCQTSEAMRAAHRTIQVVMSQKEEAGRARHVLVIGGGLTGTELAAEIAGDAQFGSLQVTLVQSTDRLMPELPVHMGQHAQQWLESRNVRVILGQKIAKRVPNTSDHAYSFITSTGAIIEADVTFFCAGSKPNSSFMNEHFKHVINERGYITVNPYLQVVSKDSNQAADDTTLTQIFACGDVAAVDWPKMAQHAEHQGAVVAENILAQEHGLPLSSMGQPASRVAVALGPWSGQFQWASFGMRGIMGALAKEFIEAKTLARMRSFNAPTSVHRALKSRWRYVRIVVGRTWTKLRGAEQTAISSEQVLFVEDLEQGKRVDL
eukprot:TRINITY_DN4456_c0_g1_i1.p1 TRINITY_DN4456_c0_g1~~TRINITY_DN4456_c0_g1_i1.p1  ORF type:complete len:493 (+),score=99.60 TRINITY_DN4456_c0_g1_i1:76-1554(+)